MENTLLKEDANLYSELKWFGPLMGTHNAIIAGGCFKDIFNHEPVRDIDMWFPCQEDYIKMLDELNTNIKYKKKYQTKHCVGFEHIPTGTVIELIFRRFGNAEQILTGFDFSIVKFAYFMENGVPTVLRHINFFQDLMKKELNMDVSLREELDITSMPNDMPSGDGLFNRLIKYTRYGYNIPLRTKRYLIDCIKSPNTYEYSLTEVGKEGY